MAVLGCEIGEDQIACSLANNYDNAQLTSCLTYAQPREDVNRTDKSNTFTTFHTKFNPGLWHFLSADFTSVLPA